MTDKRSKDGQPKEMNLAKEVRQRTGISFRDHGLLEQAFTHSSSRVVLDYQRLEFLGDRVLGLVVADMLYQKFPGATEGELSLRLNGLVNAEVLAEMTDKLDLSGLIRTGSDVKALAARKQLNMRADIMEALIAVIYLQDGLEGARAFIHAHWEDRAMAIGEARADAKTALQEWAHQTTGDTPRYTIEDRSGPDHEPVFTVTVKINRIAEGRGKGSSKREAEQAAALEVLTREGVWKVAQK